ncbi:MAG: LytR/AlgR family response regulator transcription factor [Lachnospiraceae bacterium]
MKAKNITKTVVINHTRKLIHLALSNRFDKFLNYVSEDFIYIADYDALYTKDRDSFAKMVCTTEKLPPVVINREEYELLTHERSLWMTFGRAVVETTLPDATTIETKFHFTLTLKNMNGDLRLIHAMACHVPDAAATEDQRVTKSMLFGKSALFRRMQIKQNVTPTKLCFHDVNGIYYYLYPNEILFFEADDHRCIVHTSDNSFACQMKLSSLSLPSFYHVSRSYLVNILYVTKIERYKATIADGSQFPISRSKYMEFKNLLEGNSRINSS